MGAERTFADFASTRRLELTDLIDGGALREGDTLFLRAKSDLGKGREAERHVARIEGMGVEIVVLPTKADVRAKGRPARVEFPDIETFDLVCGLWYSPAPQEHVEERAKGKLGVAVGRNWINPRCGPRNGSKAKAKRVAMLKKLNCEEGQGDEV